MAPVGVNASLQPRLVIVTQTIFIATVSYRNNKSPTEEVAGRIASFVVMSASRKISIGGDSCLAPKQFR